MLVSFLIFFIDKLIADQLAGCYFASLGENDQADADLENLSDIDDVEVHLSTW